MECTSGKVYANPTGPIFQFRRRQDTGTRAWWNGSIFQLKKTPSRFRQMVRERDGVIGRAGQIAFWRLWLGRLCSGLIKEALRLERLEKAGGRMRLVLVLVKSNP